METLKPKRRLTIPLSLTILSTALLLVLTATQRPLNHLQAFLLPPCGHIVLISAARHGSSWFLNSAERCPSPRSFERLNHASELWNRALPGPARTLTPSQAGEYAERNHSLKVFPLAFFRNASSLELFLDRVKSRHIPLFLLTRSLAQSYRSHQQALKTKKWNVNERRFVSRKLPPEQLDHEGELYVERLLAYFKGIREMLRERQLAWDEFDYDDVVEQRVIVGQHNRCIIRNCNF